mgnify:CR=1 FL=1
MALSKSYPKFNPTSSRESCMVDLATLQAVSYMAAAIGVTLAAICYILTLWNTQKNMKMTLETRQAQLFTQIYNRWNSRDVVRAYGLIRYKYQYERMNDFLDQHGQLVDPEAYADFQTLNNFFEGLGVLVKKGMVDIGWVEELFAGRIVWFWKRFESLFMEARKRLNDPTQYSNIEYLYNEMTRRERQRTSRT